MKDFEITYNRFGEHAILIEWPSVIDEFILKDVLLFKTKIINHYVKLTVNINHAYNSILVSYYDDIDNVYGELEALKLIYKTPVETISADVKLWKIPVCYNAEFALDLEEICAMKNISKSDLIQLHYNTIYTVYFIGFLPGFLYLGGLNNLLSCPRKSTPRLDVKKGSVAIGGNQTGVYPISSPGGWNIIGNSPIDFFKATSHNPCFARPGDKVQFYKISITEHHKIKKQVIAGLFELKSEVIDG